MRTLPTHPKWLIHVHVQMYMYYTKLHIHVHVDNFVVEQAIYFFLYHGVAKGRSKKVS